ncbi:hypothetical protein [Natrinema gari]|uniref:Uncharacterized protein n=1 Tax=Natrinema gari JCM 14663 TaxID=1230459 RepID=L9YUG9_9EURY|nr:hypothetical protein [Natrinema gari]ELY77341.1 hypothetical protein C486_16243 [Natrinema gari JCM 14663]
MTNRNRRPVVVAVASADAFEPSDRVETRDGWTATIDASDHDGGGDH